VGTFFLIKRKVFLEVNWDNPVPHLQFNLNARKKGYKVYALPYLKIYHANIENLEAPHYPVEYYVQKGLLPASELEKIGYKRVGRNRWEWKAKPLKMNLD